MYFGFGRSGQDVYYKSDKRECFIAGRTLGKVLRKWLHERNRSSSGLFGIGGREILSDAEPAFTA